MINTNIIKIITLLAFIVTLGLIGAFCIKFVLFQNYLAAFINDTQKSDIIFIKKLRHDGVFSFENKIDFNVQVVKNKEEVSRGLGGINNISDKEGMLFVFDSPQKYGFWMKNMRFPIDIVWLNSDMRVIGIDENIPIESYPKIYYPSEPVLYVLEIKAGLSEKYGIKKGDVGVFKENNKEF